MQKNSFKNTIRIVLGVSLVCSLFVSATAILLHSKQRQNQRQDRIRNILVVADLYEPGIDIEAIYQQKVEPQLIALDSGDVVNREKFDEVLNIDAFDIQTLSSDPRYSEAVPPQYDKAKLKQRPQYMVVYRIKADRHLQKLILPIYGKGLWSTLYGFIALDKDLRTITGITFYEHKETPGLGGEVDNLEWKNSWEGKQAFDGQGRVIIEVTRGEVGPDSSDADHQISGLSGATITSRGVNNLVRYWLGEHGYGPYLKTLEQERKQKNFANNNGPD
ncbi:MAG: Na(+)-translocating NADH-quinone reductase subunit C [Methylicorpusculum sp.]|uniref:Na(+)-translocating NADH-quinone reductase subunit C n=1 Tax=Methylicorpusculum sp. TaxID=2713644 RepID=UPI00271697CE|nr:Na(+)-translocating NADH-quinone reductase subunit C [Methylicorpusculum sp.]MDO8939485.1 Na(+)-translocating NADH-quinone reductase subunit C [Methylicorpusculum sp.]MDP2200634.1 Na(+)-translocating NADH-quinone reductase subunit C [Methylicorpusculum sp.]